MRKNVSKKNIFTLVVALFSFAIISFILAPSAKAVEFKDLNLSIGGLVEVEAYHSSAGDTDTATSDTTSGFEAATVELAIDADINENVNAHVLLLWEGHGQIEMDEATIEITTPYEMNVVLGKLYVPFGVFNSHFITDPQTLELGETNESAVMVSYEKDIFSGSIAIFNGDVDDTKDNVIDDFVLSATATPRDDLSVTVSYISDIADADLGLTAATVNDKVAGIGFSATFEYDRFTIEGEYVGALEDFNALDLNADAVDGDLNGDRPSTFNLEVAYAVNDRLSVAGKIEGNTDMFDFPESQLGAVASYELFEHTGVAVEFLHGEFALAGLDDRDVLTGKIEVEF